LAATAGVGDCDGANGQTDFVTRTVRVRDDVHATGCRGRAEVEAESVAFLVLSTAGVYSFAYVARWSGGIPSASSRPLIASSPVPVRSSQRLRLTSKMNRQTGLLDPTRPCQRHVLQTKCLLSVLFAPPAERKVVGW